LATDSAGNIYIADTGNDKIRKITAETGIITTVAGTGARGFFGDNGQAVSAELKDPQDVAVDSSGNIYIADSGNYSIRKVSSNGIITTIAGTGKFGFSGDGGPATNAELFFPAGVAGIAGNCRGHKCRRRKYSHRSKHLGDDQRLRSRARR
jgi:DNA-binding beta-propeller fold protein YncE